jgi:hypothetical protein
MEDLKEFNRLKRTLTVPRASQGWEKVAPKISTTGLGVPALAIKVIDAPRKTEI